MRTILRAMCCVLLMVQLSGASSDPRLQSGANSSPDSKPQPASPAATLEDGTPVKLRISQTVSSADARVDDRVEFEVLEEIKISDAVIVPKGGIAWGTVTVAQPRRRLGRGGKLEIVMDAVRLVDGERAALRATKDARGGGHVGAMTLGIVASGLFFFPVAPLFLLIQGKNITIPKGTEIPTFIKGNYPLELERFPQTATERPPSQEPAIALNPVRAPQAVERAEIAVSSIPNEAEIELDGIFVGSTPFTVNLSPGDHRLTVKKSGFKMWERKVNITSGRAMITAELKPGKDSNQAAQ